MNDTYQIPSCFYRTSIKALVFDEQKKFLLTKDEKSGKWDLPGGGLDWGEDPHSCLHREIKEEMGIKITWIAESPSYFVASASDSFDLTAKAWITNIIYIAKFENLNFIPSNECIAIGFFSSNEAKNQNLYSNVLKFTEVYNSANH